MEYFLMRKDEVITICEIDEKGNMLAFSPNYRNPELAPLGFSAYDDHIQRWWHGRQVPIRQGKVEEMLRRKGFDEPGKYLLHNLGLSLTDYYWIRPVDSSLKWRDVNLYENDFRTDIFDPDFDEPADTFGERAATHTPNSSLKGDLEKAWVIRNGRRILIKGNHSLQSIESINEVIAAEFHRYQGYENHTDYSLIRIRDRSYDYGCWSAAFTSIDLELISAYELLTSKVRNKDISDYEALIETAEKLGIDAEEFRNGLEYQILSDYVLSNVDRHMDNIGVLRDAKSLKILKMAPIFDTGRAFGGRGVTPYTDQEIDHIEVNSFEPMERGLLKLIRGYNDEAIKFGRSYSGSSSQHISELLDLDRLLPSSRIAELYANDSKMSKQQIDFKVRLYEKKIERVKRICG